MSKLTIVQVSKQEFDKITLARLIVGLITYLGIRDTVLKMLRGY